jgi:hypothetical protein
VALSVGLQHTPTLLDSDSWTSTSGMANLACDSSVGRDPETCTATPIFAGLLFASKGVKNNVLN